MASGGGRDEEEEEKGGGQKHRAREKGNERCVDKGFSFAPVAP